jgi:hypothetical protein
MRRTKRIEDAKTEISWDFIPTAAFLQSFFLSWTAAVENLFTNCHMGRGNLSLSLSLCLSFVSSGNVNDNIGFWLLKSSEPMNFQGIVVIKK